MAGNHFEQEACERVMQDLIDCLFAEGFFAQAEQELVASVPLQRLHDERVDLTSQRLYPGLQEDLLIWRWTVSTEPLTYVITAVTRGIAQHLQRIRGTPVYLVRQESSSSPARIEQLDPVGLMELIAASSSDPLFARRKDGATLFLAWLKEAIRQTTWSLDCRIGTQRLLSRSPGECFRILEQCASLRDRPFHPVSKVKMGFTEQEYRDYMAELGQDIPLRWMAVSWQRIEHGAGVKDPRQTHPAQFLLSAGGERVLREEMQWRGLSHTHIALPVHPWQMRHVLPKQLAGELHSGACVPLDFEGAAFRATSSVRSFAPLTNSPHHLKLPLGIYSLGASRYLPAVKLINGQRSQALMMRALALDPVLQRQVFLCDETKWWAYMPQHGTLFDESPRHFSAMVRSYPSVLIEDPDCKLIPMAALGMLLPNAQGHLFDEWLQLRQWPADRTGVLRLFREISERFMEINLRMFQMGMLAEIHGQNAVLVWRNGQVSGLLLRDHDSLRVHVPWLVRNGLADPEYRLRPGQPNTLYHDTPEELLFYLQTLGIQVNARAIIEALTLRYGIKEALLWSVLREVLDDLIERLDLAHDTRVLLRRCLFDEAEWPLKLLIRPMIERAGGPGSMPFGKGRIQNPFHHLS